jgi:hypothetical protein
MINHVGRHIDPTWLAVAVIALAVSDGFDGLTATLLNFIAVVLAGICVGNAIADVQHEERSRR